jgi:ADP-heptose:LPS heptosyltransferase
MSLRKLEKFNIRKILVVSLTNIGDVVLTCPVIDSLITRFPLAEISVVVGPKATTLFEQNPYVKKIYTFTKKETWIELLLLIKNLQRERFDVVIDLRNTAFAYILGAPFHTFGFFRKNSLMHKREQHFLRLTSVFPEILYSKKRYAIFVSELLRKKAESLLQLSMETSKTYFVVSAGAADFRKRWTVEGFIEVCQALLEEHKIHIFFIGDDKDREYTEGIVSQLSSLAVNLAGKVSLLEAAWILRNSRLVLCNDSAVLHLASYFDVPVVGLFGPTNPQQYGPWGEKGCFIQTSQLNSSGEGLIEGITAKDVLAKIKEIL